MGTLIFFFCVQIGELNKHFTELKRDLNKKVLSQNNFSNHSYL